VYHITLPEPTSVIAAKLVQFDSAIRVMYPTEYLPIFDKISACGAACIAADGIHLTAQGNDSVYVGVVQSRMVVPNTYTPSFQDNNFTSIALEPMKSNLGIFNIGGNNSFAGSASNMVLGSTNAYNLEFDARNRKTIYYYNQTNPTIQWASNATGEFSRLYVDSLSNTGLGKSVMANVPTAQNNTIFGAGSAAGALAASSSNTYLGAFVNAGITGQSGARNVGIGFQTLYYENRSDKFGVSSGQTQNLLFGDFSTGQLSVNPGTNGTSPLNLTASAQFEVKSTSKGNLLTVMTSANRTAITSPATGLHVTNSDSSGRMEFYDGSAWQLYADRAWTRSAIAAAIAAIPADSGIAVRYGLRAARSAGTVSLIADTAQMATKDNVLQVRDSLQGLINASGASSGSYTPTVTGTANVSAVTPEVCYYMRIGNVVTVWGYAGITATAILATTFEVSLPIASNLNITGDVTGEVVDATNTGNTGFCLPDISSESSIMTYNALGTGLTNIQFRFTYPIKP
jgi:hypothetical protein